MPPGTSTASPGCSAPAALKIIRGPTQWGQELAGQVWPRRDWFKKADESRLGEHTGYRGLLLAAAANSVPAKKKVHRPSRAMPGERGVPEL
jgi:hypothetical protein